MSRGPANGTGECGLADLISKKYTHTVTFDYVIVGAGPSAMGLLMGLLEEELRQSNKGEGRRRPWTIAIVERGGSESPDPSTRSLNLWYKAANARRGSAKQFTSEITGRALNIPVGQGLGGTSNINAGLVTDPLEQDFNQWPEPWKSSLVDTIGYVKQRLHANGALRCRQSVNRFQENICQSAEESDPKDVARQLQWQSNVQTLEAYEEEMGPGPGNRSGAWIRRTYFDALIKPLLCKYPHLTKNLHWFLETEVQRLLVRQDKQIFESGTESRDGSANKPRVYGVECRSVMAISSSINTLHIKQSASSIFEIHASYAVIMCSGAVESPALLLVSGIGPEHHHDFQGVGRHLKDQVLIPRSYLVGPTWPWRWSWWTPSFQRKSSSENTNSPFRPEKDLNSTGNGIAALGHIYLPGGRGDQEIFQVAMVDAANQDCIVPSTVALAFRRRVRSRMMQVVIECLFEVVRAAVVFLLQWTPLGYFLRNFSVTSLIFLMHPKSEGCVKIQSRKPDIGEEQIQEAGHSRMLQQRKWQRRADVTVQVDAGYLKEQTDMESLRLAWNCLQLGSCSKSRKSSNDKAYSIVQVFPKWLFPQPVFQLFSQDWFSIYCTLFTQPYYHFSGSCAMQRNPQHLDWVVDAELRLREHEGIFVCDASVLPSMVSSPPALVCCAMGFLFSERLLSRESKCMTQPIT